MSSSANPAVTGQATTVGVNVTAAPPGVGNPTGTVDLFVDGDIVASASLVNGKTKFVQHPALGEHQYTATYEGDNNYAPASTTVGITEVGNIAGTRVKLSSQHSTTTFGHSGAIIAKVSAAPPGKGVPTGYVLFTVDVEPFTVPLVNGVAQLPLADLDVGTHVVTAFYLGDTYFAAGPSPTVLTQTIT